MKKLRIGINGFGRIGRIASRIILERDNLTIAAINSRADVSSHAYLLKYDSTYGMLSYDIKAENGKLKIDNNTVDIYNNDLPLDIPWKKSDVDIVIDATGKFRTTSDLQGHLKAGAEYTVLSAPAKDSTKTLVLGVNEKSFNPKEDYIISNSSCTTNCLSTTLKVLHDNFSVRRGYMTTTHAVTDSQNLLDNSHSKEVRLRRSAFASMIPSSTGSAKDIGKLYPDLSGKIVCQAIRVPLFTVSLINLTVEVTKKTDSEKVNQAYTDASKSYLKNILSVTEDELVSRDLTGSPYSSIVDTCLTRVLGDNLINVFAWYDNEWGYTSRLVDIVTYIGKKSGII